MARPSVVLPEPDSPTTPRVWPSRTVTVTPSTALTWPTVRRRRPALIGNQTLKVLHLDDARGGRVEWSRGAFRLRGEEARRVGVGRAGEHLGRRPGIDDLALEHHGDTVGHLADDAEVMGDEEHGHAEPALQLLEEREDLRLDGDVESGGRLVGDEEVGLVGEGHGDHDALALPARELVRIGAEPLLGLADADLPEELEGRRRAAAGPTGRDGREGSRRPAAPRCEAGSARSWAPGTPW